MLGRSMRFRDAGISLTRRRPPAGARSAGHDHRLLRSVGTRAQSFALSGEADAPSRSPAAGTGLSPPNHNDSPPNHNEAIEMVLARLCEAFGSPADGCGHASEPEKLDIWNVAKAARPVGRLVRADHRSGLRRFEYGVDGGRDPWRRSGSPAAQRLCNRALLSAGGTSVGLQIWGWVWCTDADPHAGTRDGRRLHESHPGVMIFRSQTRDLKVLLLARRRRHPAFTPSRSKTRRALLRIGTRRGAGRRAMTRATATRRCCASWVRRSRGRSR